MFPRRNAYAYDKSSSFFSLQQLPVSKLTDSVIWQVTLTAESFGGCLALRCMSAAPELFERAVLVNPATCFAKSYGGLLGIFAGLNLLSVFPEQLYKASSAYCLLLG